VAIADNASQTSIIGELMLRDCCWSRAMRLDEVAQQLRSNPSCDEPDRQIAWERLNRWESQLGLSPEHVQNAWRQEFGWSSVDALRVLSVSQGFWQSRQPPVPDWVKTFSEICILYESDRFVPGRDFHEDNPCLCRVAWPWIRWARQQLDATVSKRWGHKEPVAFDRAGVADIFVQQLVAKLYLIFERTLVLEINVARVGGHLVGANETERYNYFCDAIATPRHAKELWIEYPVLARLLTEEAVRWVDNTLGCLTRLENDFDRLSVQLCSGARLGRLKNAEFHGDPH